MLNMCSLILAISIMIPALHDLKPLLPTLTGNAIHQPVLAENAAVRLAPSAIMGSHR
jgi:hypothetical protein